MSIYRKSVTAWKVKFNDARFEYSSSNPSSFSLSSYDVTPHPHPTHSAFSEIIIQWWNPKSKSENCWRSRYHPPWRKYFFHLSSGNVLSSAWKCQPYNITPTTFCINWFCRKCDSQTPHNNGQTCSLAWPRPSKNFSWLIEITDCVFYADFENVGLIMV